jgi:hypothetical protein
MKKSLMWAVICFLLLLPIGIFAQSDEPVAILEYYEDDWELEIYDSDDFLIEDIYYGMEMLPGDKIKTYETIAEIRLDPNGSIIKLARNTSFKIDAFQAVDGAGSNDFSLISGKLRTVASNVSGSKYKIKSPTAVCGVRGTDFGMQFDAAAGIDAVLVKSGAVEFAKNSGESLMLGAGQFANAMAASFQAVALSADQIAEQFADMAFDALDPEAVPSFSIEDPAEEEEVIEEEEEVADEAVVEDEAAVAEEEAEEEPSEPGPLDPILDYLRETMGMEMGSVTIDGVTYSKVVLQPNFTLGKLKMGLYLPVIYTGDMFDPDDWYQPKGNNEWDFGRDLWKDDPNAAAMDAVTDLALKIKYLQWGEQRDDFFLKIGNLNNMSIGHGSLMWNYANDAEFPAVRRVGINAGFKAGKIGLETVVNDVAEPEIYGGRFSLGKRLAFGISAIADFDPAGDLPEIASPSGPIEQKIADAKAADPRFLNFAGDIDLPIIEKDMLSIIIFADVAGMIPYLPNAITSTGGTEYSGFVIDALYDSESGSGDLGFRNYGIMGGLMGNIFIVDYRLEFRNFQGTFRPAFYDAGYDKLRADYAVDIVSNLNNDALGNAERTMGIYGEGGFSMVKDKIYLELGYMWPWAFDDDGNIVASANDTIHAELVLEKGLIPILDISGSISYDRNQFITPVLANNEKFELFNEKTVFQGELVYPMAPTLDVALMVSSTIQRDDQGLIIYDADGDPKYGPSVGIETRIHF